MIKLIYPEKREVSEETLLIWAKDAFADGETEEIPETVDDAIRILEDIGYITINRR